MSVKELDVRGKDAVISMGNWTCLSIKGDPTNVQCCPKGTLDPFPACVSLKKEGFSYLEDLWECKSFDPRTLGLKPSIHCTLNE